MRPEVKQLLTEMLRHATRIQRRMESCSLSDFLNDETVIDSVGMNFIVIGESLNKIKQIDLATASRVSEFNRIIGFRHQLVHGYSAIDDEITWKIIQDKLPTLIAELETLLAKF